MCERISDVYIICETVLRLTFSERPKIYALTHVTRMKQVRVDSIENVLFVSHGFRIEEYSFVFARDVDKSKTRDGYHIVDVEFIRIGGPIVHACYYWTPKKKKFLNKAMIKPTTRRTFFSRAEQCNNYCRSPIIF